MHMRLNSVKIKGQFYPLNNLDELKKQLENFENSLSLIFNIFRCLAMGEFEEEENEQQQEEEEDMDTSTEYR